MDEIVYYDGLGRPFQTVQKGITPSLKSLVSLQEYDEAGRKSKSWLPVTSASDYVGSADVISSAPGNYNNDSHPYHQPVYESSPLNRIIQQYGPGADWHSGHPIATEYLANTIRNSAFSKNDFYIWACSGTNDVAYDRIWSQVQAMAQLTDVFSVSNLTFHEQDGARHEFRSLAEYLYNVLPFMFPNQ